MLQSRDWVDMPSGSCSGPITHERVKLQSRDWVDMPSGFAGLPVDVKKQLLQSRDWVDMPSGMRVITDSMSMSVVAIPRLG